MLWTRTHARYSLGSFNSDEIDYTETFSGLQAPVTQSHIHIAQPGVNGSIVIFLCQTVGQLVAIFLGDASFRFTFPDGEVEDGTLAAGQVMYFDPLEHLPENTGSQSFEVILIELKK